MSSIITSTLICSISFLLIIAHVIAAQNVDEMDKTEFNPVVESQESQLSEHGDDKRATNPRNPYSWLNTDKRSKNPYSWMSSFYDTGKPIPYHNRYMSKKSPRGQYAWMTDYKRTRNPYSWMNFMD